MNISAVNCTPIKPQTSFGNAQVKDNDRYDDIVNATSQLNDDLVKSKDIKKPIAAVASIALAGLLAYASGKKIASIITSTGKNIPLKTETALKKGSKAVQNFAEGLMEETPSKLGKVKNAAGTILKKGESVARNLYKKIAYSGIADDCVNPEKATKAFHNVVGWAGVATLFPAVCSRDANDDGVADILQKSQNAYTGTQSKMSKAIEDTSKIAELVSVLS